MAVGDVPVHTAAAVSPQSQYDMIPGEILSTNEAVNLPMSQAGKPEIPSNSESDQSFREMLSQYEQDHARTGEDGRKQIEGRVILVNGESVFLDIGFKSEGILPLSVFQSAGEVPKPGDKVLVSVKGRDAEGYYELSRTRVERPKDWTSLQQAFTDRATVIGTVTGVVKGGLSVDVGVRAFMPASRSGARDAAGMEKLVEQEIRCRIIKLDVADEDVVVDRRIVLEEEEKSTRDHRYSQIQEGNILSGEVRSLTDYGAFIDLGGVDGLLHVGDISWTRISKPEDVLKVGQQVEVKVLKVEAGQRRISLGMKQLQPHPWDAVAGKYVVGGRVRGVVTRVVEFGAFVEIEPGIEGLIHISEMSWAKKLRRANDIVKPGETVDAVILGVNAGERRISLGLKQMLGDPWADAAQRFAVGAIIEAPVTSITKFGAFVQVAEGIEGLIHISEISAEKRINHPQEVLKVGQTVQAQVIALDREKRTLGLSIKQMVPTSLDEYIAERKAGDVVSGRIIDISEGKARVELGEGIQAICGIGAQSPAKEEVRSEAKADLSSLSSMLKSHWKGGGTAAPRPEKVRAGQIRKFRITGVNADAKKIDLELA